MPIYMNYDRPEEITYLVHCEKCGQTWNTSDVKELRYFEVSHENWCHGMRNKDTDEYDPNGKVGELEVYEFKCVRRIKDIWDDKLMCDHTDSND